MTSILVPTTRYRHRLVSYGAVLDFENTVARCADADLVPVAPPSRRSLARAKVTPPREKYDLCLVVAMGLFSIAAIASIRDLRSLCNRIAVYVLDAWPEDVHWFRRYRKLWNACDHLFVSFPEAVEPYARAVECPVEYLAQAIDPQRFHPDRVERPVDVVSIGRRIPEAHRLLRDVAARNDLFYYYSEVESPLAIDLEESQALLARISQSAKASVCWPVSKLTGRNRTISPVTVRWFEAAACGSVVLGEAPSTGEFRALFPYDRFVRPLDVMDPARFERTVLESLDGDDRDERRKLADHVRTAHSWEARLATILRATV
jgi:hypothetical protein